ncbi:hypothetical protein Hanom_Chr10g00878791 [Helianthus anomalus]
MFACQQSTQPNSDPFRPVPKLSSFDPLLKSPDPPILQSLQSNSTRLTHTTSSLF